MKNLAFGFQKPMDEMLFYSSLLQHTIFITFQSLDFSRKINFRGANWMKTQQVYRKGTMAYHFS